MGPFMSQKTVIMTFFTDYSCTFLMEINCDGSIHVLENCHCVIFNYTQNFLFSGELCFHSMDSIFDSNPCSADL